MSSPPDDDQAGFWHKAATAVIQGVSQGISLEMLLIIIREVWRGGPWF